MASPYRTNGREASKPKSAKLSYWPAGRYDRIAIGSSLLRLLALPTFAGVFVAKLSDVELGVVAFLGLLAANVLRLRRPKDVVVLRVSAGEVLCFPGGEKVEAFRVPLAELDDVVLETKTVTRILDVGSGTVNIGFSAFAGPFEPKVGATTDTKRILLQARDGRVHALTEAFFGDSDTTEWFGKVRRFLRSAGWIPADEREDERLSEA